jgi:hypothetical protein
MSYVDHGSKCFRVARTVRARHFATDASRNTGTVALASWQHNDSTRAAVTLG